VICPASLTLNWESEVQRFTPALHAKALVGTAPEREEILAKAGEYDLLITSYDQLKRDIEAYEGLTFAFIVADEAQYIKNRDTLNAQTVKRLRGETRLALTGTPVENSLAELWSIFDFLMPGYLFPYARFRVQYELPIVRGADSAAAERLRQLVRPFLLRRLKRDVLPELPPKTETVLKAAMESEQRKLYVATLARTRQDLEAALSTHSAGQGRLMILAALTRLRQICCDPALLYEDYHGGSVKLDACLELVESCIASGHRLLLFSQFTSMLDILETRLNAMGVATCKLVGATKTSDRQQLVSDFNQGDTPVFLISLKAGGTGLNLTGADVVIHYDPWWNAGAQNQATDRAHRIGQQNSVQVYKLISRDTVEERILRLQEEKTALAEQILKKGGNVFEALSREELLGLLEE
jgi:SNF2 family DNA or RNA helicase